MSQGLACICTPKDRSRWRVVHRNCNYSAFNGYHRTDSDYSLIRCLGCGHYWRTKADYVAILQDATPGEAVSP